MRGVDGGSRKPNAEVRASGATRSPASLRSVTCSNSTDKAMTKGTTYVRTKFRTNPRVALRLKLPRSRTR